MRFRGFGNVTPRPVEQLLPFPSTYFPNLTEAFIDTSVSVDAHNDLRTIATGKRCLIYTSKAYGGSVGFLEVKRGGTYYQLSAVTLAGAINFHAGAGFVFEAGDTISVGGQSGTVYYNFHLLEWDAPTSGPRGLFTAVNFAPSTGDNTMLTVAASCVAQFPAFGNGGLVLSGAAATNGVTAAYAMNLSGSARDYTLTYGSSIANVINTSASGARASMTPGGALTAGTALKIGTSSGTGTQNLWTSVYERAA